MEKRQAEVLVIGTGCAGYACALHLKESGKNVTLLSVGRFRGTSRNTGSDKQTYYKLSLCGSGSDSVQEMAKDLFSGGSVNGDTALCEAAGSVRAFMQLVKLGVPFPTNEFGEYVGYKTDHDPRTRATSVGPLTSKAMTEALEKAVFAENIPLWDRMQVIRILVKDNIVQGVLALNLDRLSDPDHGLTLIVAPFVVLCTGGPATVYHSPVYPESQTGATGVALAAGAEGCNLDKWQYGLASTKFRWNLSGSYQQVLPRYVSIDEDGAEREFLPDYFDSPENALNEVFLKGYQWPFDSKKMGGSSRIDLIVYHEKNVLGRRVYLDFMHDPKGYDINALSDEARTYLTNSGATMGTPIARLAAMNPKAIELYCAHGIDLSSEYLEIGLCAQHNNGGLAVDKDWQTSVCGLYCAGEAAGTFGIARPGGSALNSTQVGAYRAAEHIAYFAKETMVDEDFCIESAKATASLIEKMLSDGADCVLLKEELQKSMSVCAAQVRDIAKMEELQKRLDTIGTVRAENAKQLPTAFEALDLIAAQKSILSAMLLSARDSGSLGSGLVLYESGEKIDLRGQTDYRYLPTKDDKATFTLRTIGTISRYEPVRPLPDPDNWFETVWKKYNETHNL